MTNSEITLENGFVFKFMIDGNRTPEVYGWIEKDFEILKDSSGWYRTDVPEDAARYAAAAFKFEMDLIVEREAR